MIKKTWLLLAVLLFICTGCKRPGDVLATYEGGRITRGELYEWLDSRHQVKEPVVKSKKQQKSRLEAMALDRFAVEEAKKGKLDENAGFKMLKELAMESQLMEHFYSREIRAKIKFSVPAVRVRHIFLRIKNHTLENNRQRKLTPDEQKRENEIVESKARGIVSRLDRGEKFETIAGQMSEDYTRTKGGDAGYIVEGMMPGEYARAAFALEKGAHTKTPVVMQNGVYIIKALKKKTLTEKNIEKTIGDKMQASRIKNRFYNNAAMEYLNKLRGAPDVVSYTDKIHLLNKRDVLFKIGDMTYGVAELDKRLDAYANRLPAGRMRTISKEQRKSFAENFLRIELTKREAEKLGLDKDPEFLKKAALRIDGLLAREYFKKIDTKFEVTPLEVKAEYEKNKEQRYYSMVPRGKDRVKIIEPLGKVEPRIRKMLESQKRSDAIRKVRDEMLRSRKFTVIESRLEGK